MPGLFLFLVIFLLRIDLPKHVFVYLSGQDLVYSRHCSQHGMVLVVVLMHPVSADKKKVFKTVQIADNLVESLITAEISWISFGNAHNMRIQNIGRPQNTDLLYLGNGKFLDFLITFAPQCIRVIAEILQSNPYLVRVRDQIRAPVVEDL